MRILSTEWIVFGFLLRKPSINSPHYPYVIYRFARREIFSHTLHICAHTHNPALSIVRFFENTSKPLEGLYGYYRNLVHGSYDS